MPTAERRVGADFGAVELEDEVGEAVDHARRVDEARRDVDHPERARPGADAVEVADRALQAAEDGEAGQPRRRVGLRGADLAPNLAERRRQRSVGIKRAVAGDQHARADDARHRERQPAGRRLQRRRQNEAHRDETIFDASHHAAPSAKRPLLAPATTSRAAARDACRLRRQSPAWREGSMVIGGARVACDGGFAAGVGSAPGEEFTNCASRACFGPSRNACHWSRSP